MMRRYRAGAVLGFALLLTGGVGAVPVDTAGTAGVQVLRLSGSARAAALGDAITAAPGGPESVWTNPAGLVSLSSPAVLLSHLEWFEGIRQEAVGASLPLGSRQTVGLGVAYLHMGEFQRLDVKGNPEGTFRVWNGVASVGYGRWVSERLILGAAAKVVMDQLEDVRGVGVGGDVGIQYDLGQIREGLRAGIVAQHWGMGPKSLKERSDLPSLVRGGLSWMGLQHHLMVNVEGEKALDSRLRMLAGVEAGVPGWLWVRTGYRSGQDAGAGFPVGLGIRVSGWDLDYAFADYGVLGATHRVSLGTMFGRK